MQGMLNSQQNNFNNPPAICPSEMELPRRPVKTSLAQLHSGYCQQLKSYKARFDCQKHPIHITVFFTGASKPREG